MGMQMPDPSRESNPKRLLNSWGLEMVDDEVVGDLSRATRVRISNEGRMQTLTFELQRLESIKGQASTIASTLLANSNQNIMTIARNMRLV